MFELTAEQQSAIEISDRPLAVVAAAGSGKTRVLVERYLALLKSGLTPQQILALSFTNEAADQLKERIIGRLVQQGCESALLQEISVTRNIGTLHSFCYHTLNRHSSLLHLPPIAGILSPFTFTERFEKAYALWLKELSPDTLKSLVRLLTPRELKELAEKAYRYRKIFFFAGEDGENAAVLALLRAALRPFVQGLEKSFHEEGLYAFDDLETLCETLLDKHPEVRQSLSENFKAYLVDEFQDTSPVQWRILTLLTGDSLSKLFVVGDPKQSIYRFRKADLRLFEQVAQSMEAQEGSIIPMDTNFRTCAPLLDRINFFSERFFAAGGLATRPMLAGNETLPEHSGFYFVRYPGATDRTQAMELERHEVATHVLRLREARPEDSIALLFRVSDRIPVYQEALQQRQIPSLARTSRSLFHSYDVVDLCSYLESVENPLNDLSLAAFLRSRFVNFTYEELRHYNSLKGSSLFEKLLLKRPQHLEWFFELIESGELRIRKLLDHLFQHTDYFPQQASAFFRFWEPLAKIALVSDALERVRLWRKHEITYASAPLQENPGGVRLMTVHSAKGLEFDHVFLVDNLRQGARQTPPFLYQAGKPLGLRFRRGGEAIETQSYQELKEQTRAEDLEESKRVLYVAITRAVQSLHVYLPAEEKLIPKDSWGALLLEKESKEARPKPTSKKKNRPSSEIVLEGSP